MYTLEALEFVSRRGTSCKKWDDQTVMFGRDGLTGLWVADMDFKAPLCVRQALHQAVDFGVFGYVYPWAGYYDALTAWEEQYHGLRLRREWLRFSPGVVPAFNWVMCTLSQPGDGVLVLTPSYYPMLDAVTNNGRRLVTSALRPVNGRYVVDYEDFEKQIVENDVKCFLFCSPHNPVCRVWERPELEEMFGICRRHGVYVVSDEIHQDLVFGGHTHTPSLLVNDGDVVAATLIAPSKTFNLAGLQNAVVVIRDPALRQRYDDFTKAIRVLYGNTMGYVAAEAAFKGGRPWLESALAQIAANDRLVRDTLAASLPWVRAPELEGTYLLWLDFGAGIPPEKMADFFENRCGLAMDYGNWFQGDPCCVRMNLATSGEVIRGALAAIVREYNKGI